MKSDIKNLGFDAWFQEKVLEDKPGNYSLARISAVNKEAFMINDGENNIYAELTGKLMFNADSPLDFPTVGDFVYAQLFDENSFAIIHEIIERKSLLKRKTPGKKIDFQLIAANIDAAFIVQSLDSNFNLRRLERYLVMINESGIEPVVLLSKCDLLTENEIRDKLDAIHGVMPGIAVIPFTNLEKSGITVIKELLVPNKTYCLLGSSGVGKTTLLNNLIGEERYDVREVREKDSRGKHTTTQRQLIVLENGSMIIDNPGMRELGNFEIEEGIAETFSEITALQNDCRFKDCTHIHEKGCAVQKAIEEGSLSEERFQNYIKMRKESAYNEMSYLEKRQKDKEFGKMVKSVMKHKK